MSNQDEKAPPRGPDESRRRAPDSEPPPHAAQKRDPHQTADSEGMNKMLDDALAREAQRHKVDPRTGVLMPPTPAEAGSRDEPAHSPPPEPGSHRANPSAPATSPERKTGA